METNFRKPRENSPAKISSAKISSANILIFLKQTIILLVDLGRQSQLLQSIHIFTHYIPALHSHTSNKTGYICTYLIRFQEVVNTFFNKRWCFIRLYQHFHALEREKKLTNKNINNLFTCNKHCRAKEILQS